MGRRRGGASGLGVAYAPGLFCEGGATNHEGDEPIERRRSRISPAGREALDELERSSKASEPPSEGVRARVKALLPAEREEVIAIFGAMAMEMAER